MITNHNFQILIFSTTVMEWNTWDSGKIFSVGCELHNDIYYVLPMFKNLYVSRVLIGQHKPTHTCENNTDLFMHKYRFLIFSSIIYICERPPLQQNIVTDGKGGNSKCIKVCNCYSLPNNFILFIMNDRYYSLSLLCATYLFQILMQNETNKLLSSLSGLWFYLIA